MSASKCLILGALVVLLGACAPISSREKPRLLWIDAAANFPSYGNDADSIARDCRRIAEMGFTDIVVDVRPTSGDVLFASSVAPALRKVPGWVGKGWGFRERTADFDYLRAFIDAGHAAGLRVSAGVNVMVGGWRAPGIEHGMVYDQPERQEWCSVDNPITIFNWYFCFSYVKVVYSEHLSPLSFAILSSSTSIVYDPSLF